VTINQRTICVVEDDPAIRQGIVDSLTYAGFGVVECADGKSARRALLGADLDLALLDVVLPGMDALNFLPELRAARPTLPVIFVTARGTEEDRVRGLKGGADDYVVKPFSATELLARVEAVLRRSAERPLDITGLAIPGGSVDLSRREIHMDCGEERQLTEREAELLAYLARVGSRPVGRTELLEKVWGLDPRGIESRTIDMTIARLREKLEEPSGEDKREPRVILTLRGKGYMLGPDVEARQP
jgi:two-component system alkaline phosphatase synthesis response regulator PhoP